MKVSARIRSIRDNEFSVKCVGWISIVSCCKPKLILSFCYYCHEHVEIKVA